MNKQDNRLALLVLTTLTTGIGLIYTLVMYHDIFFAVIGMSVLFLISAFILTKNIIIFATIKNKSLNVQIRDCVDGISNQLEAINGVQAQIGKATFLYTKKAAQTVATLESNYTESQEALYKNLVTLSNAHNKATKLMIKYDQSNTTKLISTIKDLRSQLSDAMIQGFDQLQSPDNTEIVNTLGEIVDYLKSQSGTMDEALGLQLTNIAQELQNVSNNIQNIQFVQPEIPHVVPQDIPAMSSMQASAFNMENAETDIPETDAVPNITEPEIAMPEAESTTSVAEPEIAIPEMESTTNVSEPDSDITDTPVAEPDNDMAELITEDIAEEPETTSTDALDTEMMESEPTEPQITMEEPAEPAPVVTEAKDPNAKMSDDEIAALFAAAEPVTKKAAEPATDTPEETEEAFTPTFTVVGKSDIEEKPEEPATSNVATIGDLGNDPNKQLSPDEIAALFASAEPVPKKEEKPTAAEPIISTPVSSDPNKQLSADEIAALFAAAEPAPKKEPVNVQPVSSDPNKQLTPDEIAALFASAN